MSAGRRGRLLSRIVLTNAPSKKGLSPMLSIRKADTEAALDIMRKAAEWLVEKGMPLWDPKKFADGKILESVREEDLYTAYIDNKPVASLILQWSDPVFWPDSHGDSGFIHKLSVKRDCAGLGVPNKFVAWAKEEVRKRNRRFLRLDCAADRAKLCKVYEDMGFIKVDRRVVGMFDCAFYEIEV
jgi:GNAT superfamily N-acetyltransferase